MTHISHKKYGHDKINISKTYRYTIRTRLKICVCVQGHILSINKFTAQCMHSFIILDLDKSMFFAFEQSFALFILWLQKGLLSKTLFVCYVGICASASQTMRSKQQWWNAFSDYGTTRTIKKNSHGSQLCMLI